MVVKRVTVVGRLEELDRIIAELHLYQATTAGELANNLGRRWTVERGLVAAAGVIIDCCLPAIGCRIALIPL